MKKSIIKVVFVALFAFILYYLALPAINPTSIGFWVYLGVVLLVGAFANIVDKVDQKGKVIGSIKVAAILFGVMGVIFGGIIITNFFLSPVFNSKRFAHRIEVNKEGDFYKDVAQVDFSKVPLLDKDSSQKLGDRVMGQMPELVSQFYVSNLYTQINYNDSIVRVTPLEYASFFKYLSNHKEGIKGYITVNSVDGQAKLVTTESGMHYMPSAYFFENLNRKLRITYPTVIFDTPSFEIDNEGNPYWIVPTIKYTMVGLKKEISGVVILNAITGESKKYSVSEVPSWVDHVYPADLVIEQMNNWGEYNDGFINSIFGQKNVVNTTEGYNYLVMDDDVYLYTGITSVSTDESNLGFVLINLRTKETHYYTAPGAEEFSAMASAEGLVQEKGYKASFPLLINLNNKPTYLLSLKDNAGLVKMYAFVDVADYQKVVVSDSQQGIEAAAKKYLGDAGDILDKTNALEKVITISNISTAVVDGNTYYYIVDTNNGLYSSSIKVNQELLPFLKNGDKVLVSIIKDSVNKIVTIKKER